jgi:hypothetical protein
VQAANELATQRTQSQIDYTRNQNDASINSLQPYTATGQQAATDLQNRLPFLTSPIVMDQAALEQTPGYQFTKTQGLKAVQNSAAARGLGVSGAALKGAATFATGLADQTYQTQFNLENTNRTNAYDRLITAINSGQTAATSAGTLRNQSAAIQTPLTAAINTNTVGGGAAAATGLNTGANALAGGLNTAGGAERTGLLGAADAQAAGLTTGAAAIAGGLNTAGQATAAGITQGLVKHKPVA